MICCSVDFPFSDHVTCSTVSRGEGWLYGSVTWGSSSCCVHLLKNTHTHTHNDNDRTFVARATRGTQ